VIPVMYQGVKIEVVLDSFPLIKSQLLLFINEGEEVDLEFVFKSEF
jgi:hypothetical protein